MRPNGKKRSTAAATGRLAMSACAALVGLAAAASAQTAAGPISIVTHENPVEPGAFTLNFGGFGIVTSSNITRTNYELSVDPVKGTARFVSYRQHVQPLTLPGGLSTGDITVEIVAGSSSGSFDPFTRTFTTSEMYAVHFTGDLSAFGLSSPVLLPSSSSGELTIDPLQGGEVRMDWNGSGQLFNPFDPPNPLSFTYRCAVNTLFPAAPANLVGLDLTLDVVGLQLPQRIEQSLLALLDRSLARILGGDELGAVRSLRAFILKVNVLRGRLIAEADATHLVTVASEAIALMGLGRTR